MSWVAPFHTTEKKDFIKKNILNASRDSHFKSDPHLPKKFHLLASMKAFKNDENDFYFIIKALFVLKIFKFSSCLFGHVEKNEKQYD